MKVKVTVLRETNDHDGYCSGAENEYEEEQFIECVEIPEMYQHYILDNKINDFDWELVLLHLIPKLNYNGSSYCNIGNKGEEKKLSVHDYRLTIVKCEIV